MPGAEPPCAGRERRGNGEPFALKGARVTASYIEFTRRSPRETSGNHRPPPRAGRLHTGGSSPFTHLTFPCHECAKMIVGAGIVEVMYIEPYPKSLVSRLYRDVIDTAPPVSSRRGELVGERVPFRPFVGVAPRRFDAAFTAGERRSGVSPMAFDRGAACPRTDGWSESGVVIRESVAISAVRRILEILAADVGLGEQTRGTENQQRERFPEAQAVLDLDTSSTDPTDRSNIGSVNARGVVPWTRQRPTRETIPMPSPSDSQPSRRAAPESWTLASERANSLLHSMSNHVVGPAGTLLKRSLAIPLREDVHSRTTELRPVQGGRKTTKRPSKVPLMNTIEN